MQRAKRWAWWGRWSPTKNFTAAPPGTTVGVVGSAAPRAAGAAPGRAAWRAWSPGGGRTGCSPAADGVRPAPSASAGVGGRRPGSGRGGVPRGSPQGLLDAALEPVGLGPDGGGDAGEGEGGEPGELGGGGGVAA